MAAEGAAPVPLPLVPGRLAPGVSEEGRPAQLLQPGGKTENWISIVSGEDPIEGIW